MKRGEIGLGEALVIIVISALSIMAVVKVLEIIKCKPVTRFVTKTVTRTELLTVTSTLTSFLVRTLFSTVTSTLRVVVTLTKTFSYVITTTVTSVIFRTMTLISVSERTTTVTYTTTYTSPYVYTVTLRVTETSTKTVFETLSPSIRTTVTYTAIYADYAREGTALYICMGNGVMVLGRTMTLIEGYPKPIDFDYLIPCPAEVVTELTGAETVFLSGTLTFEAAHARKVVAVNSLSLNGIKTFTKNFLLVYPITSTLTIECNGDGVVLVGRNMTVGYPVRIVNVVGLEFQEPCPCVCPITEKGPITILAVGNGVLRWG